MAFNTDSINELEEFLNSLVESLSSAIFIVSEDWCVRQFNASFCQLFRKTESRVLGELCGKALGCSYSIEENKSCGETSHCHNCLLRKSLLKTFTSKVPVVKERLKREFFIDGAKILKHFVYTTRAIQFNGESTALVIVDDVSELEESLEKLRELAITDGLTGLLNHRHCFELLEEQLELSQRYLNELSIVLLDIDHFKAINDTYGHQTGDNVLAEVSRTIRENIRHIDIAARYGGEEFLIILPQTPAPGAKIIAERIRNRVEALTYAEKDLKVTISGGVARYEGQTALQLVAQADILLYTAKHNGRNRIESKH